MGGKPLLAIVLWRNLVPAPATIDPGSLTRWRQRIGAQGMEWLLAQTIKAAASIKVIEPHSLDKVIVDSTVQEKAIAYPAEQ